MYIIKILPARISDLDMLRIGANLVWQVEKLTNKYNFLQYKLGIFLVSDVDPD